VRAPLIEALIVEAVNRMGGVGDEAEDNCRRALEELSKRADEALPIILAEYEALPEESDLDPRVTRPAALGAATAGGSADAEPHHQARPGSGRCRSGGRASRACSRPARTRTAASPGPPHYLNDSYSSAILNSGRRYGRENIDGFRCVCGDGTAIARSKSGLVEAYSASSTEGRSRAG